VLGESGECWLPFLEIKISLYGEELIFIALALEEEYFIGLKHEL